MTVDTHHAQIPCSSGVERDARTRLAATGYYPLKAVSCRFRDGTLTLEGSVPSYYHKQMAQEAIRGVSRIRSIVNALEVPSL